MAERLKNRRTSAGPDGSPLPKYAAYIIYGNFILICEGMAPEQSIESYVNLTVNLNQAE